MYLEIFISTLRELHDSASKTCAIFRDWYFMKPSKFLKKKKRTGERVCNRC